MEKLTIIKVGGKIVEDPLSLSQLLDSFTQIDGYKVLVHGGGRLATTLAEKLGIETQMINGRRITDEETLKVVTMVYAGWINKTIVAQLQARRVNALGLTGADMNVIKSVKRPATDVDYGYVGDVEKVNIDFLASLIRQDIVPVLSPITHDKAGNLLNTNADTIAGEAAKALSRLFDVELVYCFEKRGVLRDETDDDSVIPNISKMDFEKLVADKIVQGGMIPKLENAFQALSAGVKSVEITSAEQIGCGTGTIIK